MNTVYNDIFDSDYMYKFKNLKFYFSSMFYLNKFRKECYLFIKEETLKLKNKFKNDVYAEEVLALLLYKKIEKRGFRVYYNDKLLGKYDINLVIR